MLCIAGNSISAQSELTLQPPKANQAHVIDLRRFAKKETTIFNDGGADYFYVGAVLFDVVAKPLDRVKAPAGVDRLVDAIGIERKCVAGMDFHFALLITKRIGHA